MKAIRATVVSTLQDTVGPTKAKKYEGVIFALANRLWPVLEDESLLDTLYKKIAYEKLGQLLEAKTDEDRTTIIADVEEDDGSVYEDPDNIINWNDAAYENHRLRYVSEMDRTQQRPKAVKGMYTCKMKGCNSDEFYVWQQVTRSADEGSTNFRQCARCGKRGKE